MQLDANFEITLTNRTQRSKRTFSLKVDLSIQQQRTVIFGASGCGKTLTLQAISGLIKPDSGLIQLNGKDLYNHQKDIYLPARKRHIGMLFQNYSLFPHLTVLENVGYAIRKWPLPLSKAECKQVIDILEILEIANLVNSLPSELSGGQQQRVALARTLIHQPHLILLDEPLSAMDMLLRIQMRQEINTLLQRFNIPLIMITHDLEDVKAFADNLILYHHGHIAKILNCQQLKTQLGPEEAWQHISDSCQQLFSL